MRFECLAPAFRALRCLAFAPRGTLTALGVILLFSTQGVQAQSASDIIKACTDGAAKVFRTMFRNFSDYEQASFAYAKYCSVSSSYVGLSSADQQSFGASYAGYGATYGNASSSSSMEQKYDAFCSQSASTFRVEERTRIELTAVDADAGRFLDTCLKSGAASVSMAYNLPVDPSDALNVIFSTIAAGKQINGIMITNGSCTIDGQAATPAFANPRVLTTGPENNANVRCVRSSRPISIYGINGHHYPRTQVTFFTNYATAPLEITLPEEITGDLQARLSAIEGALVPPGTVVAMRTGQDCAPGWSAYGQAAGRVLLGAIDDTELAGGGGGGFEAGKAGGREKVELKVAQMPRHDHGGGRFMRYGYSGSGQFGSGNHPFSQPTIPNEGGGQAFSIMPPYLAQAFCVKN